MHGASRDSLIAVLRHSDEIPLAAHSCATWDPRVEDMLAVVRLLGREPGLRNALTDSGVPKPVRARLAMSVLASHVDEDVAQAVAHAAQLPWAHPRDLVDALEIASVTRAFHACERDDTLDDVEDELFRFGRLVAANPQLRAVLDDQQRSDQQRIALLHSLLEGKVVPTTLALLEHLVGNSRVRRFSAGVTQLGKVAHSRREELTAQVFLSAPMSTQQHAAMAALIARMYHHSRVRLQVVIDPDLMGGAVIRVGHDIIDGSGKQRLRTLSRRLLGQDGNAPIMNSTPDRDHDLDRGAQTV